MASIPNGYIDVLPEGLSWREWSDAMNMVMSAQALPIVEEDDWELFANELISTPSYGGRGLPDPFQYTDWRIWAYDLVGSFTGRGAL